MSLQLCFWVLMLLWAASAAFSFPRIPAEGRMSFVAGNLLTFVLFLILGWRVFGAPVNG